MRILRATGSMFILIGATLMFFVVYELVGTSIIANNRQEALAEEFDTFVLRPTLPRQVETLPPIKLRPKGFKGPEPIARIRIPKIDLRKIVVEGSRSSDPLGTPPTLSRLSYGPAHYRETADIGQLGTTAVAAHRTGWGGPFMDLDKLRRGDSIFFDTVEATYRYEVTRSTVVDPEDTKVLLGDPRSEATRKVALTTCTPKYTARQRLVVWGDLVETVPRG